jgi:hypothetical protein
MKKLKAPQPAPWHYETINVTPWKERRAFCPDGYAAGIDQQCPAEGTGGKDEFVLRSQRVTHGGNLPIHCPEQNFRLVGLG